MLPADSGNFKNATSNQVVRQGGFSLVELMVVFVIVAITAALAAPSLNATIRNYRAGAAARQLMTDMQFAKMGAVSQGVGYRVTFSVAQKQYRIQRWDRTTAAWVQVDTVRDLATLGTPYFVSGGALATNFTANRAYVEFTPLGTASTNGTATISVGTAVRNVSVNAIGRVRIDAA